MCGGFGPGSAIAPAHAGALGGRCATRDPHSALALWRMSHQQFSRVRIALAVPVAEASLPIAPAAHVPSSTFVNVPTDPFVGENVSFTLRFDNTHASLVGYGPYIDLILPATGADGAGASVDDGIT